MIKTIGLVTLIYIYIVMILTFIRAYLHPSKSILISINKLGEANIDLFVLLVTLPCVIFYIYKELSEVKQK